MDRKTNTKPLGQKAYGSIPHLPNSRVGPEDHHIPEGQAVIATIKKRDKHDLVIVQEKLDGSNMAVAKINGEIIALTRSGYVAETSKYLQQHIFSKWVEQEKGRFNGLLKEGERVCGEWLALAHGTKYNLPHEPFVVFDILIKNSRCQYNIFENRVKNFGFTIPSLLHVGDSFSIESALNKITTSGHGAIDEVEGCIWRVERKDEVDFLCKYVKPGKQDGKYFAELNNGIDTWNIDVSKYI